VWRVPQILIIYAILRGNTGKMVEPVAAGIRAEGVEARILPVDDVTMADMTAADGIIIGSPTRLGAVDWQLKRLFDVETHAGYLGPLDGKVAGAFTSGSRAGSGAELALLNVLHILLNHGMIVQGDPYGPHYGPVALREHTEDIFHFCETWGARWARLVKRLAPAPTHAARLTNTAGADAHAASSTAHHRGGSPRAPTGAGASGAVDGPDPREPGHTGVLSAHP
jgi:NAD(P)H dehydrogenase (quinone)